MVAFGLVLATMNLTFYASLERIPLGVAVTVEFAPIEGSRIDEVAAKFDVVVRQGTAGLQMRQTERFQAERGLSPAAYIGGSEEEMRRIPAKNQQPGFGGDSPEFSDRGKGGDKPDFADLVTGKCKGRTSRDQITFYRNVGNQGLQFSSVGGWVYKLAKARIMGREIPTEWFLQDIRD